MNKAPHKIITFLGILGKQGLVPTEYRFGDHTYSGNVFPEALLEFVGDFDEMLVFVTDQARQQTFDLTLGKIGDERIRAVSIPAGESDAELWRIFETVTNNVDRGDTVTFDLTHGLRSIPFLVFLAAAFLKAAKDVTIAAIYYGALELKSGEPRYAPVIDLSSFVALLDWINATNRFTALGDSRPLTRALRDAAPQYQKEDRSASEGRRALTNAANALDKVSLALQLILPDKAMEASETLREQLVAATAASQQWAKAKPFTVLAEQVTDTYNGLALPHPRDPANGVASLARERDMIDWYLKRNLPVQAVTLAREWLVSWAVLKAGRPDLYDKNSRSEAERALNYREDRQPPVEQPPVEQESVPELKGIDEQTRKSVLALWSELSDIRNTLSHANKRPDSKEEAAHLKERAEKRCKQLDELMLPEMADAGA